MSDTTSECTVLLFAELAERAGTRSLTVQLGQDATVADVLASVAGAHPTIAQMLGTVAVAMNEQYVQRDTVVTAAATIALIPPVSGG